MADVTVIGRGSKITGRITGEGNVEILGHVAGEVFVSGDITVGEDGTVGSSLTARRVVVRGAVRGDISGSESIALDAGARVVGDLRAPRIQITSGALIKGAVQTAEGKGQAPRARGHASADQVVAPAPAKRPVTLPRAAPAPAPTARAERAAPAPTPAPARVAPPPTTSGPVPRLAPKAAPAPAARKAPAPVVPVLKKGAKGALKKRAGG